MDKARENKDQKGRALLPDEIQSILNAAEGLDLTIIAAAIATGMRRGEQFGLGWEHIDFDQDVIHIRRELYWRYGKCQQIKDGEEKFVFVAPKSNKSIRDIDMPPALRKQLLEHSMKSGRKGLVFPGANGRPMQPDNFVERRFAKILEKAESKREESDLSPIENCAGMISGILSDHSRSIREKIRCVSLDRWDTRRSRSQTTFMLIKFEQRDLTQQQERMQPFSENNRKRYPLIAGR